jgi:hypothetical protein
MQMEEDNNFAVFILTHGRSDRVFTYDLLRKQGYTGKIYLIIDDEDKEKDKYFEKYKDEVIIFSKEEVAKEVDVGDNFPERNAVVYARNQAFKIAKDLGLDYFLELDDDYTQFDFRVYKYGTPKKVKNLDRVFEIVLEFYKNTPTLDIAMAQGGDFIGGSANDYATNPTLTRKCMNTHFLSPNRPFPFLGKINEDVNTPVTIGSRGGLFFTFPLVSVTQKTTQSNPGGLTDIYLARGTFVKSFYSVIFSPSSCKVAVMGDTHYRLHHRVIWDNAVPKIISEDLKKK